MQKLKTAFMHWVIRIALRQSKNYQDDCAKMADKLYADIWPKHDDYAEKNKDLMKIVVCTAFARGYIEGFTEGKK